MKKLEKIVKSFAAVLFLLTILLAFAASFLPKSHKSVENRNLAALPQQLNLSFPRDFDAYYQDNFPRRLKLIRKYNKFRYKQFRINNFVIFGENGWWFFNSKSQEESDSLADYLGTNLYDQKQLDQVVSTVEGQIEKLEKVGAKVYVVIAPNKSTIYPQFMPEKYRKLKATTSRLDQVEARLRQDQVNVIPLTSVMKKSAELDPLYLKTDSHWNNLGGYLAYQEIIKKLKLKPYPYQHKNKVSTPCGDLDGFVKLKNCQDTNYNLSFNGRPEYKCQNAGDGTQNKDKSEVIYCESQIKNNLKLLVIRDSFFNAAYPYLVPHFKKTTLLWRDSIENQKIESIIKTEKPNIIVLEYVERYIDKMSQIIIPD